MPQTIESNEISGSANFKVNNAEDLFLALSHYSKSQREMMLSINFNQMYVVESTLTDGSKVMDFGFRNQHLGGLMMPRYENGTSADCPHLFREMASDGASICAGCGKVLG